MENKHNYTLKVKWTGNTGTGTSGYKDYERSRSILVENKVELFCSADPVFRGDGTKHNPEDLLLSAVSSCHMLFYLHLCAAAGIIVTEYIDQVTGIMAETGNGDGKFTEVTLNPTVTITDSSMVQKANELHKKANELCFIANSLNVPVYHKPICRTMA